MEKNIPIDQLFKNKLSNGQEQLNLGAWANMERILDGKNPYAEEESNKKRRILPLFLALFILIGGALTAGYIKITEKSSAKNDSLVENNQPVIIQKGAVETISPNESNDAAINASTSNPTSTPKESIIEPKNELKTDINAIAKIKNSNYKKDQNTIKSKLTHHSSTINQSNNTTEISKSNIKTSSNAQNTNSLVSNNETIEKTIIHSGKNKLDEMKNNPKNQNTSNENKSKITKTTSKKDTISVIEIKEKTTKNRMSKKIEYDTLGKYSKVVETIVNEIEEENKPLAKAIVLNPRMVKLSAEEELNASKRIDLIAFQDQKNNSPEVNNSNASVKKETKNNTPNNGYTNSIFNKMKAFSNKMAMKKIEFYPGMSVGVNAAFINTEHNYGGFHFGLNNLIPVSNYFSILSELKLFYKNNSGYSVNDKKTSLFDYNADINTLSAQNKTIHTTTIDSTTRKYNFKSFATIELPIMLQAHIGKATPYIGFNLAYSLKLNTTSISKNYAVKDTVILNNSVAFTQPTNISYEFIREDFGSRFGIGYSIGASYSLNPNLYIDLRLSNVLKDNSKTLSAREISDGIFKVPFVQFSIGYRFKKFTPNN